MGVGDDQLDPAQAAPRQALQKARPERLGLRGTDVQPDDLTPAIGVGGNRDYCRDRNDAAALALLQVGGIEPQIWPLAAERPGEKSMHALVDVFAQLGDLRFAQRAEPGIQGPVAMAVAPGGPLTTALMTPGPDQPIDVGLHQQLQHRLRHGSQKIALASLLQQLGQH
jgi:hypothetical protein